MARRLTAEAGMMMPTYDSDGTFLPKVSGVLLLRMSLHERLCATTLRSLPRTCARAACLNSSIVALCGTAEVRQTACWAVPVPRGSTAGIANAKRVRFNVLWPKLPTYG